ncbi:hypothetical protein [Angustibacter aerolatus]
MTAHVEALAQLNERARGVGESLGWSLAIGEIPQSGYGFLTAQRPDNSEAGTIVVFGPKLVDELLLHEFDHVLDQLAAGARHIAADEDGDPRLV